MSCERASELSDPADIAPDDPHLAECAECRAQLAALGRIARAMRDVGAGARRAPDHLDRVWSALDRPKPWPRRRTTVIAAAGGLLAMAAGLVIWLRRPEAPPRFSVEMIDGHGAAIRGDAHLGDRLRIRARAEGMVTVRVYRNDRELLLECPRMCAHEAGSFVGDVALDAIARYQVVWISGAALPAPHTPDDDIAAASASNAHSELRELEVR